MPSFENAPWPAQTAVPAAGSSSSPSSSSPPSLFRERASKRRRGSGISDPLFGRQVVDQTDVDTAEDQCQDSGNDVITCFPTDDSPVFPQHQYATVVWNSRLPQFTQTDFVNVYLHHADSRQLIQSFLNRANPSNSAGSLTYQVNDSWFGDAGADWSGSNLTYTFYWVVTRNDTSSEALSTALTQTHFTAVQTTYADSVLSSMALTSSASTASQTNSSPTGTATGATGTGGSDGSGNVQSGGSDSGFPHWAIAVIVVLGLLAIATSCILAFFILRRIRRRNAIDSNRNSMGSASPMMAHAANSPGSPLLATAGAVGAERQSSTGHGNRAPSIVSPDGASSISRTGSAGDAGPFSGADAAIMADAFRKALRKPDFAGATVEEGDSPDTVQPQDQGELLNRELADEGRDIRSVSSSRGVRVETLSDSGDTVHDDYR